ncbi:hypothetical protein AJ85_19920 [Alkalihalobacillus alcalophilus ATCC 27647 = CGMCC 1.3604]|uniref:Uncharacterized protein n=1 Tax=Alkalihalobacillus alcalophilus ATCC 27647 = CGMCC 1.3604 TaxID=1218173 RepID=A0A094WDL3_ALKAL|nr:hypothetical protein [Alkalihalobacillus alcalophilus]KGA95834.1 hypothetical protein BALCAV_0219965 [Alkalihalobacillus alcalophilus ATCC 27647 = CGMCC 1.3604]MED1562064.1 hypothetical protein [Alkalihalobacillus alcalophilus]THG89034.1 hypothetical protein AJ85_19920 [Alkalihalobacillus alcalophilus ATCC 27647 = CGMCC 1.3604]
MAKILSSEELMKYISSMNSENSVFQFSIPGKGKFTLVLQEDDEQSIKAEAEKNPELKRMLKESMEQYENGKGMTTTELLRSLSKKDFTS